MISLLHLARQVVPDLVGREWGVQQERRARRRVFEHVDLVDELELVAGDEPGAIHEIRRSDGARARSQMRNGDRARLLRVVDEVALGEEVCLLADDLDGVLVGTDGPVGAEAVEDGRRDVLGLGSERRIPRDRRVRHVVDDANGEVALRRVASDLVEDRFDHRRRELLRRQPVAARDDPGRNCARQEPLGLGLGECRDHVEIERVAGGAGLFRPIEHRQAADGAWECREKRVPREWSIQPDFQHADLLAARGQDFGDLVHGLGTGSHQHNHALGVGIAGVLEQLVAPARQLGQRLHLALDDSGAGVVEAIGGLARLKEHVRVLGGPAQHRPIRREPAAAMLVDRRLANQRAQVIVAELLDLGDLVRGAEAIEEVQKGDAGLQRRRVSDGGHVVCLLDGVRAQEGESGLAAGHDVRVVAEDRQGMRGERAGRHVHREGRELAGDLVHVGDHQQQALRGREGGRERARLQRAVDGAGRAPFRLHFRELGNGSPEVRLLPARPLVADLRHRTAWCDRVDGNRLARPVGDRGDGLVAVHRYPLPACHVSTSVQRHAALMKPHHCAAKQGTFLGADRVNRLS